MPLWIYEDLGTFTHLNDRFQVLPDAIRTVKSKNFRTELLVSSNFDRRLCKTRSESCTKSLKKIKWQKAWWVKMDSPYTQGSITTGTNTTNFCLVLTELWFWNMIRIQLNTLVLICGHKLENCLKSSFCLVSITIKKFYSIGPSMAAMMGLGGAYTATQQAALQGRSVYNPTSGYPSQVHPNMYPSPYPVKVSK